MEISCGLTHVYLYVHWKMKCAIVLDYVKYKQNMHLIFVNLIL